MIVGGRNARREIQANARLHSPYFPEQLEQLQRMRLKREACSICLLQSDIECLPLKAEPFNSKVLVVGGVGDSASRDYQSTCELFDL